MKLVLSVLIFAWVNTVPQPHQSGRTLARQPVVIYKTKKMYDTLVPVLLSEDRRKIISYPDPADVYMRES